MAKRPASPTAAAPDVAASTTATKATNGAAARGPGPSDAPTMTPAAALARHVEWLEYALGAARAEETVRAGRIETATKKNRAKRSTRLAEVREEIDELTALIAGIRDLQAKARGPRAGKAPAARTRTTAAKGTMARRRPAAGSAGA